MPRTPDNKDSQLRVFTASLHRAAEELSGDLTINQLVAFLEIAAADMRQEHLDMREVASLAGLSPAGASRALAALVATPRPRKPGYEVVTQDIDVFDRRRKTCSLTTKGRRVITNILSQGAREAQRQAAKQDA